MTDTAAALLDRERIRDIRPLVGRALDTWDWEAFGALFTDEMDVDLPALGLPSGPATRAELVAAFQRPFHRPFHRSVEEMPTQQLYSNIVIDVNGDSATVRSCLLGHHHVAGLEGGEDVELRAVYTDRVVRTGDGWRIRGTAIEVQSIVGNPAIFA